MKVVKVLFDSGFKEYSYLYLNDEPVERGDWLVVMTPRGVPAIVTVTEVSNALGSKATKPVLLKLGKERLDHLQALKTSRAAKILDAKKRLDEKLEKFKEYGQYEALAAYDPEAAVLLDYLKRG